jgi:hypothetical protein
MRLKVVFAGSVPKDDSGGSLNEDHYVYDEELQRFCLSDGAGQSYAPALWSNILSNAWIRGDGLIDDAAPRVEKAIAAFERECEPHRLTWSRAAAFERGTFATLLGVRLKGDRLRAVALGDSLLLLDNPDEQPRTFPYDHACDFDLAPFLLSTKREANLVFTPAALRQRRLAWRIRPGSRVMLMTDALGRWLLDNNASPAARAALAELRTHDDLLAFVLSHRADGSLKLDDCTLIHLLAHDEHAAHPEQPHA